MTYRTMLFSTVSVASPHLNSRSTARQSVFRPSSYSLARLWLGYTLVGISTESLCIMIPRTLWTPTAAFIVLPQHLRDRPNPSMMIVYLSRYKVVKILSKFFYAWTVEDPVATALLADDQAMFLYGKKTKAVVVETLIATRTN